MQGRDEFDLVCTECGSVYKVRREVRLRGPGRFSCLVCGEDMLLWTEAESLDYDVTLVQSGHDGRPTVPAAPDATASSVLRSGAV
jgi:hypothetical protein